MWSIVHTEWSVGFGGQEHRILQDCREMMRRGHRVSILCRPGSALLEKAAEAGIRVFPVPIRSPADLASVFSMARFFRRERVDIVNTHSGKDTWVASMAAKIVGVPLLLRTRHISIPIRRRAWNLAWHWPDGYITTGEPIREHLILQGIPADRVVSIPTGVDVERYAPRSSAERDGIRKGLGISGDQRMVSSIGVLRRSKRVDQFVDMAALLSTKDPRLRFWIVGNGPQEENIRKYVQEREMGGIVSLLGFRSDIPEILAATDVMVMTSEHEGVPQVVLQALAMEVPVVSTPVGAIREVVSDGETGLLCPVGDVRAFAEAVSRLLSDPELRARLGTAGREVVVAGHSTRVMGEKTEAFCRRLAAMKGVPLP